MSSLTLNQKNPRRGSSEGWKGWRTLSGYDYNDSAVGFYVVYSASLNLTDDQRLTGCSVTTRFSSNGPTGTRTLDCYLYTFDPTGSSSPPSGYTAKVTRTESFGYDGMSPTFTFTGIDIRSSGTLYFWFSDTMSGSPSDYQHSDSASVSGNFSAATLSLSVASSNVTTGSNQTITIGNGAGRSLTVRVYYGNTQLFYSMTNSGTMTFQVPKSWFTTAGLTAVSSFSVSVRVDQDSSLYETFTVTAGSDMLPTVSNITTEIVQSGNAATYFPTTYIANISKCKVTASAAPGSNAAISAVKITYPGGAAVTMSYNSSTGKYEGTTAALTVDTALTVTATDQRGLSGAAASSQVTVVQYSKPTANINFWQTYRCDSSGSEQSGGAYWRAGATATYYTSLSGNALLQFKVQISGGAAVDLSSDVQSAIQGGSLNPTSRYTLIFTIQDKVSDPITKNFTLDSVTRNVVIRRNSRGTTLGVGTTPQRTSGSSVELPASGDFLIGGIPAQAFHIPLEDNDREGASFGKDFLSVNRDNRVSEENADVFFSMSNSFEEWSNYPPDVANTAFVGLRGVLWLNRWIQMVYIVEFMPVQGRIWTNLYNGYSWSGWTSNT